MNKKFYETPEIDITLVDEDIITYSEVITDPTFDGDIPIEDD